MRLAPLHHRPWTISLAPLTDVVFLLLAFVMMTATLEPGGPLQVTPPEARHAEPPAAEAFVLLIDAEAQLALDGNLIKIGDLEQRLRAEPIDRVTVEADRALPAGRLFAITRRLYAGGVRRIDLVTLSP
jgi:biopolymer transport protein ExbD